MRVLHICKLIFGTPYTRRDPPLLKKLSDPKLRTQFVNWWEEAQCGEGQQTVPSPGAFGVLYAGPRVQTAVLETRYPDASF